MLIPIDEITSEKTGQQLLTVADVAEQEQELNAINREMNLAANTGEFSCVWQGGICKENRDALTKRGVVIEEVDPQSVKGRQLILSWRSSDEVPHV